jgi:hypothetical protein
VTSSGDDAGVVTQRPAPALIDPRDVSNTHRLTDPWGGSSGVAPRPTRSDVIRDPSSPHPVVDHQPPSATTGDDLPHLGGVLSKAGDDPAHLGADPSTAGDDPSNLGDALSNLGDASSTAGDDPSNLGGISSNLGGAPANQGGDRTPAGAASISPCGPTPRQTPAKTAQ